jgi:hypothetical protein
MKKNILNSFILLLTVMVVLSCKTKKAVVVLPPVNAVDSVASKKIENIRFLKSKDLNYNILSFKSKASLNINGDVNNVNMNVRIKKDQKIWISITAIAGIEVARALITPDSIFLRNNLQSTYLAKPFKYIQGFANKQVNFKMLQSILSGNTISEFMEEPSKLEWVNGVWVLSGSRENLGFNILYNTLNKVSESSLNDAKSGQALKINYGEYQQLNSSLFPSTLKINSMSGPRRITVDLTFSKVESNVPFDFPFTVPKRFKVIN